MKHNKGLLIVLSGPSGVGKGTIYHAVLEQFPQIRKSISVTTRAPRQGEVDGVHYHFRTVEEYQQMIARGDFLETAEVYCNYYGTPKAPVFQMLERGEDVMFEVDVHGARQIQKKYPMSILIYVFAPTFSDLEHRLRNRGTDTEESIRRRLSSAHNELSEATKFFDYIVFNDQLQNAVSRVTNIIDSERSRLARNADAIRSLLDAHDQQPLH